MRKVFITLILISASRVLSVAQGADSAFVHPADSSFLLLDDELSFDDSLSIFQMIDSLLQLEDLMGSQIAVRLNYNSNVMSAGRTLGINQFGLASGVSYYHKTGLYADVTTYYSNDYDPAFYLSTASAGYMRFFTTWFSLMANYDHFFYNLPDEYYVPYSNALTISPYFEFKGFAFRVDYSFYFGDDYAHRIMPGLGYNYRSKKLGWIDRISVNPVAYVLFGDERVYKLTWRRAQPGERLDNRRKYGDSRFTPVITETVYFGVMNYAFTLPVTLTKGNLMFNVSYTYSVPVALGDEPLTISETGYLSSSLIYYFSTRRKSSY